MGERALLNRIKKLQELETQQKELAAQIEELKGEIRADMDKKGVEQQKVGNFIIRLTKVLTRRFDGKAFQKDHGRLYEQYCRQQESRRFSVVAQG